MATVCNVTRREFTDSAKQVCIQLDGQNGVYGEPRTFSSGSIGWYANGKGQVMVNGKPVKVQIGVTVTVIGSKELPEEESK